MKIFLASTLAAAALLSGCASMNTVTAEVSTYGSWPAERKPATYAFERLPSQQERAAQQDAAEVAARNALQAAGFTPAAAGTDPDVLVQVGSRVSRTDYVAWDDPLWWRGGGFGRWRYGPWTGPYWGYGPVTTSRYEHEVALLIRDRADGKPLYEAHARSDDRGSGVTQAMFSAALKDFPAVGLNPRTVTVAKAGEAGQ